ncbi:TetR/AcrR family transcriptional regulator [Streptomyces sp. NPDC127084]|uniref:TetR/AcrR family transcriptional regulator n=1 Tax=Streptomyces sp. NPDC127084 TaxID=3347133 RepID=UPI00365299E5
MPPQSPQPVIRAPQKPPSATSQKVLRSSRDLFLEFGYDGVNLDLIAKHAGVARQTVYNLFGSKEAVFRATMEYHWAAFGLDDIEASLVRDYSDPAGFLRHFAETLLDFINEKDQIAFTRLVIAESRKLPWVSADFYRLGKAPLARMFSRCLAEMTESGALDCPQPDLAARQFLGLIQEFAIWPHVMAIGEAIKDLPPIELVVEEAIAMFLGRYQAEQPGKR